MPMPPAAKTAVHPQLDPAKVIAQAAKNLRDTAPYKAPKVKMKAAAAKPKINVNAGAQQQTRLIQSQTGGF